jgi:outer membrane protein
LKPACLLFAGLVAVTAHAQKTDVLTLRQAEDMALKHHPRLFAAMLNAEAAQKVTAETRSALLPTVSASVTGVAANDGTAVAAGALTTSSLSSRFATGFTLVQMVTDFGRTSELTRTASLRAEAASRRASNARAQILLAVRSSYFSVLGTEAVQKAAEAALDNRRLLLRQVTALQQSAMKSTLDVSFAQVLVSEAEMALYQAQNNVQESRAALAAALGIDQVRDFSLSDEDLPPALAGDAHKAIQQALADRPDVSAMRSERDAAHQFAKAEGKLSYPTVNLLATAGAIPVRDHVLPHNNYEAAGVTVNIGC